MSDDIEVSETGPYIRPFVEVFVEQRDGRLAIECGELLHQIVSAVYATQKAGALTIKLNVKPSKMSGVVMVEDQVTAKVPEDRGEVLFFVDEEGNLTRMHPNQPRSPLKGLPNVGESEQSHG